MLQHFQFKPLFTNKQLPGWKIQFYYDKQKYECLYLQNGTIEWSSHEPPAQNQKDIKGQIHELMLFHVYE